MAKQEVDIGTEGNDGTGDSIRESFRKVNENFQELYAVFGVDGNLSFLQTLLVMLLYSLVLLQVTAQLVLMLLLLQG